MDDFEIDFKSGQTTFGPNFDGHIGRNFLKGLKAHENNVFQVECSSGDQETCGSVRLRSIALARNMRKRGLKVGDFVITIAANHLDSCLPFIASQYIGVTPVGFMAARSYAMMKHLLSRAVPKMIFSDLTEVPTIQKVLLDLDVIAEIVVFGKEDGFVSFNTLADPTGNEDDFVCEDFDPTKTISYAGVSSGTTGRVKLLARTHLATSLYLGVSKYVPESGLKSNNFGSTLVLSPLSWSTGYISIMNSCINGSSRIVNAERFTMNTMTKAIEKYKPNSVYFNAIEVANAIKKAHTEPSFKLPWLRTVFVGGSTISAESISKLQKLIPDGKVVESYGICEIGSVCLNLKQVKGSVGQMNPWIQWKVVGLKTGNKLEAREIGELRVKSMAQFREYLGDPENTTEAFDSDGYFKTGDLMYYDENKNFFIVDRIKETIRCMHKNFVYNVFVNELEQLINSMPGVFASAVVGVNHEGDSEHPLAFVEKMPDAKVTAEDIKEFVRNNLEEHKQLKGGVIFLSKLPLTHSGKVDRQQLRSLKISMKVE